MTTPTALLVHFAVKMASSRPGIRQRVSPKMERCVRAVASNPETATAATPLSIQTQVGEERHRSCSTRFYEDSLSRSSSSHGAAERRRGHRGGGGVARVDVGPHRKDRSPVEHPATHGAARAGCLRGSSRHDVASGRSTYTLDFRRWRASPTCSRRSSGGDGHVCGRAVGALAPRRTRTLAGRVRRR